MKLLLQAAAIIMAISCVHALEFTEVFPNPEGSDNYKEFVELQGTENLHGCFIRDASSEDKLALVQKGNDVILIIEDNSTLLPLAGPTIYSAGSAIGNGLGNTADDLAIYCKKDLLANTSYAIASVKGYKEGFSLIFNGTWILGQKGGTPGVVETFAEEKSPEQILETPAQQTNASATPVYRIPVCNDSVLITVSATNVTRGEQIAFSVIAPSVAQVAVRSENETIFTGDTSNFTEFVVTAQREGILRISAQTENCNGIQRSTRVVAVQKEELVIEQKNASVPVAVTQQTQTPPADDTQSIRQEPEPMTTGKVVLDNRTNTVPWVAGFGIVTLIVSAVVFFKAER